MFKTTGIEKQGRTEQEKRGNPLSIKENTDKRWVIFMFNLANEQLKRFENKCMLT